LISKYFVKSSYQDGVVSTCRRGRKQAREPMRL
jgi:hypothetical protein